MSLITHAYRRDPQTNAMLDLEANQNDIFGFETWRKTVWGHSVLIALGCVLIPSLCETDVYAEKEDIKVLEKEVRLIENSIKECSHSIGVDEERILSRIKNLKSAIEVTKRYKDGGVYIG